MKIRCVKPVLLVSLAWLVLSLDHLAVPKLPLGTAQAAQVSRPGSRDTDGVRRTKGGTPVASPPRRLGTLPADGPIADPGGPYVGDAATRVDAGWTFDFDGSGSSSDTAIVQWQWDFGMDTFDGSWLNTYKWNTANVYNDDALVALGTEGWGGAYAVTRESVRRAAGVSLSATLTVNADYQIWGFKTLNNNYDQSQMVYGFYCYGSWVRVYENGAQRGHYRQYTHGQPFDARIDLKEPAGARYYLRMPGETDWSLVYDSNYASDAEFLFGFSVYRGKFVMDNLAETLGGETLAHKVYVGGPVTLTVTDSDAHTGSADTEVIIEGLDLTVDTGGPYVGTEGDRVDGGWTFNLDASASADKYEIVETIWDLGTETFDGKALNKNRWFSNLAYCEDEIRLRGVSDWTSYLYSKEVLPRVQGNSFEARVTPTGYGIGTWGLKNTNADFSHPQMPYAMYFNNNAWLYIFENGSNRGNIVQYAANQSYDLRIELKPGSGARYYWRPTGEAQWTLLYDSNYGTDTEFLRGITVYSGDFVLDDVREVFKTAGTQLTHKVYWGGPATVTVRDSARQERTVDFAVSVEPAVPTADVGGPYALPEDAWESGGWNFTFDASGSTSGHEIVAYEWDFGVDTFDGDRLDPGAYWLSRAYQDGALYLPGASNWENTYAFARQVIRRAPGALAEARLTATGYGHAAWGLKNTSASYHLNQMPYAIYFMDNGWVYIYENGASRGNIVQYAPNQAYDLRIELKDTQGARYFWKTSDQTDWTLLYDSYHGTTAELLAGMTVYSNVFALDDLRLRYYDQPLAHKVPGPTSVNLTVTDSLGQSASDQVEVRILGNPPQADAGGPYVLSEPMLLANHVVNVTLDASGSTDDSGIVRYVWDFGVDTLDGQVTNAYLWSTSNATQNDHLSVTGNGNWGGSWAFHKQIIRRSEGMTFQCRIVPVYNHAMVGFKNLSSDYSYTQMPYALYFAGSSLIIYEDANSRGHVGSFTSGQPYDVRIILKEAAGATYWVKSAAEERWTRIYDSNYGTATEFLRGIAVHSGTYVLDDLLQVFPSTDPTVNMLVTGETTGTLTVYDRVGRSDTDTAAVIVTGGDPFADAGGPYAAPVGSYAVLDGSGSHDDFGIVQYHWDFGDGGSGEGEFAHHIYTAPGVYTVTLTVYDAGGHSDSATAAVDVQSMVVTVPWDYDRISGREVPHNVWTGLNARLRAVLYTDTPLQTEGENPSPQIGYTWDFGDGSDPQTGFVADKRVIDTFHTYSGSPGALFTATLTIHDPVYGDLVDTYPVQIHERDLSIEVNVAIEEGLWYLHKTQETAGTWESYGGYRASSTSSAVHAMEINGHVPSRPVTLDPLVADVIAGLDAVFGMLQPTSISIQPYGDPDSNGNGIGIGVNSGRPIYEGGMVMDAIAASATPDKVALTGPSGVRGRTYRDILQDMVDMYAWGQSDAESWGGGWRYSWNADADNSACQWAAIGFQGARTFGLDAPDWVKERNNIWLTYSYNGTGFGYGGAGNGEATTPSGMVQLAFCGYERTDPRWQTAEAWIANNWNWYKNINNVYAWYAFVKSMRVALPTPITNLSPTGLDWYHGQSGLVRYILGRQQSDGGWPDYYGRNFATAWQVVILTPTLFTRPPVAAAGADVVWAFDVPLTFDGSRSYHTDPVRVLVQYEWDFDGDGVFDYIGAEPTVEHTYVFDESINYPITYTARLRVTDDIGQTDTDTRDVTVAEPPHAPFAVAGGPYTARQGVSCHPNGSGSFDIDPTDYITRQDWDFNGSNGYDFDHPDLTIECLPPPNGCPTVTWVYDTPGVYHIGLRVWDNGVLNPPACTPEVNCVSLPSLPDFATVTVMENVAPVADAGGLYTVDECQTLRLDGTGSYDPDGDPITYAWDLDDDGEIDDSTEPAPTYRWDTDGVYSVGLVVSDGGLESEPAFAEVVVRDTGPSVTVTGPDTLMVNQWGRFEAAVDSPCDAIELVEWDWDYDGVVFVSSGDTGVMRQHAYFAHGTYLVAVRVADTDGSTALDTHRATVDVPVGPRVPAGQRITVLVGRRDYDMTTHTHRAEFTLVSESDEPITGPIVLSFADVNPPTVMLLNPDGEVPHPDRQNTMIPYVDLTHLLVENTLLPGESLGPVWMEFGDPNNVAFTFDAFVYVFNSPPRVTSAPVVTGSEGRRYRYDVEAVDDDGDMVLFELGDTGGVPPPEGMSINPITGLIDWVPGQTDAGEHQVTVLASDGLSGGQGRQSYTLTIDVVNVPPIITSAPPTTAQTGVVYEYDVETYDPDGDVLTYALDVAPAGMTIDPNSGLIEWLVPGVGTESVGLVVFDDAGNEARQAFTIVVPACAEPPVIQSTPVVTATEGEAYSHQVQATGPGGALHYTLPVAPSGMTIDQTGLISWTPGFDAHGKRTVKVVVTTDVADCRAEQIFQIEVADVNAPPEFVTTPVTAAHEGVLYRYAAQAIDPDGDSVSYALVVGPEGMSVHLLGGVVEWTPSQTASADSPYLVIIEAIDPAGAASVQSFEITVAGENLAPRIVSVPVYGAVEAQTYEYDVEAVDPDEDTLTYALEEGPEGMTIDEAAGLIQWTPSQTAARGNPYGVRVRVSDPAGHVAAQVYNIFVRAVNVPPVIVSEPTTAAVEGEIYYYLVQAEDEDGDSLTYSLSVSPGGMSIHPRTGFVTWLVPQTAAVEGPYDVTVVVSDGVAAGEQSFAIVAEQRDSAPMIFSTPVTEAAVGALYTYDVQAYDLDRDPLTYTLEQAPDGMSINPDTGLIEWLPAADQVGEHSVTVVVTDPTNLRDTQDFVITTAECPDAPRFTSEPRRTARPLVPYQYDVDATVQSGQITFSLTAAPSGTAINAQTGLITWAPTEEQMGVHDVTVLAMRDDVCPSVQSFQIEVKDCALTVSYEKPPLVPGKLAVFTPRVEANCLPLRFELLSAPAGMVIDPTSGEIQWIPQIGLYTTEVRVIDDGGIEQTVSFGGEVRPQTPPQITSTPSFTAQVDELYEYQITATDDDGDTLTYSLPAGLDGMVMDEAGLVTWTPTNADIGSHEVQVRVDDGRGGWATQTYVLTVSLLGDNHGPRITSTPPFFAAAGQTSVYQVEAEDEDGDELTFTLDVAPTGMVIDPETGLVTWDTTEADVGTHPVRVRVLDPYFAWYAQSYDLLVYVNAAPRVVSAAVTRAIVDVPYVYSVKAVDDYDTELTFTLLEAPAGMTIGEDTGVIIWTPSAEQEGAHNVCVVVADSLGAEVHQDFAVTVYADATADIYPPQVTVTAEPDEVNPGEPVTITVVATDDFAVASVELTVNHEPVALDAALKAVYNPPASGAYVARAVATDVVGRTGSGTDDFFARSVGDVTAPEVIITTPEVDADVTAPTQIVGTASDENLFKYTLAYRQVGEEEFIEFAAGYQSVTDGVLGTLDTTLLRNGLYEVRLQAQDTSGNVRTYTTGYSVTGDLKVGNFSVSFTDLQVPLAGIPITLTRTYDSRNKTKGDYGYGWTLDIAGIQLEENKTLGKDWEQSVGGRFIHIYMLQPLRAPIVSVTWPDGRMDRFQMTVNPSQSPFVPLDYFNSVSFIPIPPTTSRLEILGDTSGYYDGGAPMYGGPPTQGTLRFYDDAILDPGNYRLTTYEGMVYTFSGDWGVQISGLQSIADRNDNQIQIVREGIVHSSGVSVPFERDDQDRITKITDPKGGEVLFTYDDRGDLISVTDASGNTTQFVYDAKHYLLEIIDPLGNQPARNIYDDSGRLIATVDAQGNRVEFQHDLNARQEVVKDRLGNVTVHEYDEHGNVTATIDALGHRTEFTHDDRGNELTQTNPLGNTTTYTYDQNDNLLSKTDALGNRTEYTYGVKGRLLTVTDPGGNVSTNVYDSSGNLIRSTDALGNSSTYTYDAAGNQTSAADPLARVTTYAYDAAGNLIRETTPDGYLATLTYDANGNRLSRTVPRTTPEGPEVLTETYVYDAQGRRIQAADANGNVETTEYTATGRTSAVVDRLGHRTEHEYNVRGQLVRTVYPDGTEASWTYDAQGNRLSAADRAGHTTTLSYDALNRLIRTTYPDGTFAGREYDSAGRVVRIINERGHATVYGYDAAGRKTSETDVLGNTTTFTYDGRGKLTARTDARGNTTQYENDALGRCVRVIYPDGTTTTTTYDAAGRRIAETDPAGHVTQSTDDESGDLTSVTDALGGVTRFAYDETGNLIVQTDANGHVTRFAYDKLSRRTKRTLALGMLEQTAYDAVGNRVSVTDFKGQTIGFGYDADKRLTQKSRPDGQTVTYAYTASGLVETVTDSRGITTYEYDSRNRLLRRTEPDGTQISYTYDAIGNRTSVTTPGGTTTYTYDALNRLETATDPNGGVTAYTYDAAGNRNSATYPNGVRTNYTYDNRNRLTYMENVKQVGGEVVSSYAYTLGPAGNRTRVVEHTGRAVDYEYDALNRLTKETIHEPGGDTTIMGYTYDAVGNRLSRTVHAPGATTATLYTYDANDRLVSESTTVILAEGRLPDGTQYARLAKGSGRPSVEAVYLRTGYLGATLAALLVPTALLWPRPSRMGRRAWYRRTYLRTVALFVLPTMVLWPDRAWAMNVEAARYMTLGPAAGGSAQNGTTITYTYDANGNLIGRTDGTKTDTYTYDAENRLIAADVQLGSDPGIVTYTYDHEGIRVSKTVAGVATRYLVDHNAVDARVLEATDGTTTARYLYGDDLIAMQRSDIGVRYYLYDGQMSVRQLADETGTVTDTYTYDAFGGLLASTGTTPNEFRYTGEQYDANVGFYYLRARYYDPSAGRFTAMDRWEGMPFDPPSLHKYTYCHNDPVNNSDPSGNMTLIQTIVVIAIIAIVVAIGLQIWENETCKYFDRVTDNSSITMANLPQTLSTAYGGVFAAKPELAIAFRDRYQSSYQDLRDDACGDAAAKVLAWVEKFDGWVRSKQMTSEERKQYKWSPQDDPDKSYFLPLRAQYAWTYLSTGYMHQMTSLTPRDDKVVSEPEWIMLDAWKLAPVPVYDLWTLRSASLGTGARIGEQGGI